MISKIVGEFKGKRDNLVLIDVNGLFYEIMVPQIILHNISKNYSLNDRISLCTFHYHQITPSKSIPILIGFTNEVEKDFFINFISVSGVGPKVAIKAINRPISFIAKAIAESDIGALSSLPGIGKRKAREIIARLQGKIGKYGLIQDDGIEFKEEKNREKIKKEAMEILTQLKYRKKEAEKMIVKAFRENDDISSIEDLLNQVYKQKNM